MSTNTDLLANVLQALAFWTDALPGIRGFLDGSSLNFILFDLDRFHTFFVRLLDRALGMNPGLGIAFLAADRTNIVLAFRK